jgi:hypothetical protein
MVPDSYSLDESYQFSQLTQMAILFGMLQDSALVD